MVYVSVPVALSSQTHGFVSPRHLRKVVFASRNRRHKGGQGYGQSLSPVRLPSAEEHRVASAMALEEVGLIVSACFPVSSNGLGGGRADCEHLLSSQ